MLRASWKARAARSISSRPGRTKERSVGRVDRPEVATLGPEGIFEEEGSGIEKRLDLLRARGPGPGELGVARVGPPDLGVEGVQLGPDLLALDLQSPGLRLVSLAAAEQDLAPVRLQGQAAFEVPLPRRERRVDAALERRAALAQDIEKGEGAGLLARFEGGPVEALTGACSRETHQDIDTRSS